MCQQFTIIGVLPLCLQATPLDGQGQSGTIRLYVRAAETPVEKADVLVSGVTHQTDRSGVVVISVAPATSS
jgi:hypothetical protein